jgi:very-short-patch-repair endonuclease
MLETFIMIIGIMILITVMALALLATVAISFKVAKKTKGEENEEKSEKEEDQTTPTIQKYDNINPDIYHVAPIMRPGSTTNEEIFRNFLQNILQDRFRVFSQVTLNRVLDVRKGFDFNAEKKKINSFTIDFIICNPYMKPIVAIELDDKTHERPDRIQRDEFINMLTAKAGLPLFRYKAKSNEQGWTVNEISDLLDFLRNWK